MHPMVRPATLEDLLYVGANLKDDDKAEYERLGLTLTVGALELSFAISHKLFAWGPEGKPLAIFGVTPDWDTKVGYIWSISTPEILEHWREVHRSTPAILDELGKGFLILSNVKEINQKKQIRWLKSLGFIFISTTRLPNGTPVHEFVRIQK